MRQSDGFNAKREIAETELRKCAPFVALTYADRRKKEGGILLATKSQSRSELWFPVAYPRYYGGPGKTYSKVKAGKEKEAAFILAGIGNSNEISDLHNILGEFTIEWMEVAVEYDLTDSALECLADEVNDRVSTSSSDRPYAVELLLIDFVNAEKDNVGMYRIKYDGDNHPSAPYCILGGSGPVNGREDRPQQSIRHKALELCARAYVIDEKTGEASRYPTLKKAEALAERILALDPRNAPLCKNHISWKAGGAPKA